MESITTIIYKDKQYCLVDDLKAACPIFFHKCRYMRSIIKEKKLTEDDYVFAQQNGAKWKITQGNSKKADKVFVKEAWVMKNIPEFAKDLEYDVKMAPYIIDLKEEEKFHDDDGNVMEIETRGVREVDKCYFLVKDVAVAFELKNLYCVLIQEDKNYEKDQHYVYFNIKKINNGKNNAIKKELFLTYEGVLRVLFTSRVGTAHKFVSWCVKTLFTMQLGTKKQKEQLVGDVLGFPAKVVREVFNKTASTLPCIYLFTLGTVTTLRKKMEIADDYKDTDVVCKYGFAKDLAKRTGQHIKKFGAVKQVDLKLKFFSYIDPLYISSAEVDIKEYFTIRDFIYQENNCFGSEELVIIPEKMFAKVEKQFAQLGLVYAGHIKEEIEKNLRLQAENAQLKSKLRIVELEAQLKISELNHEITRLKQYKN